MQLVVPLVVLVVSLGVGRVLKGVLFKVLNKWGLHLATQSPELPRNWTVNIGRVLLILWIISLALMAPALVGPQMSFSTRCAVAGKPLEKLGRTGEVKRDVRLLISIVTGGAKYFGWAEI